MKIAIGPLAEGVTEFESVIAGGVADQSPHFAGQDDGAKGRARPRGAAGLAERDHLAGSRLGLRVKLTKMGEEIMVEGEISGEIEAECSRCLEPFHAGLRESFTVLFAPASQSTGAWRGRGAFSKEDQQLRFYREGEIDLTEDIRATVELAVPLQWICREDCLGLCRRCGQNLNDGPCTCPPDDDGGGYYPFRGLPLK